MEKNLKKNHQKKNLSADADCAQTPGTRHGRVNASQNKISEKAKEGNSLSKGLEQTKMLQRFVMSFRAVNAGALALPVREPAT